MTWEARRTYVLGEPFPHSNNRVDTAGRRIRHAVRDGEEPREQDVWVVEDFRRHHLLYVQELHRILTEFFHQRAGIEEEELPITSRHKTPGSITAKVCRSSTALSRMQDIAGARVVVRGLEVQNAVVQIIVENLFRDCNPRVDDQREIPDNYSYRAVHVIVHIASPLEEQRRFGEIQIRTLRQESWAQMVERLDRDFGWDLKHGDGPAEWLEWLHDVSDELRKVDLGEPGVMPPSPLDMEGTE